MRNILISLIAFISVCVSASAQKSIVILFDNDVHCNVDGYKYMAGLRNSISRDTAYVAFVSSGDYIQGGTIGAISKGEAIMTILKNMNYDAIALGNHEFDYDAQYTYKLMKGVEAPVVCCNYVDASGSQIFMPYRICQYGDKRVAYVGVTTPNTLYSKPSAFQNTKGEFLYDFSRHNLYDMVQRAVDDARAENADYVVLLSHVGEECDSIGISSHQMIAATTGVDAVFDGHTHSVVPPMYLKNAEGKDVLIVQTGTQFSNVGKFVLSPEGGISAELIPCFSGNQNALSEDERIAYVTDSIKNYYEAAISMPVGHSQFDLTIYDADDNLEVRYKETNAGDLVADAIRACAEADVALVNGGAIRNECAAGNLKRGDFIAMCPYDNNVVSMKITGEQIVRVLESSLQYLPHINGNFPQVSGVRFKVNVVDDGANYISEVKVLDQKRNKYRKLKKNKEYRFATTDFFLASDQFKVLDNNYGSYINHHEVYSQAVINLVHDIYDGEIPNSYSTEDGRIIF